TGYASLTVSPALAAQVTTAMSANHLVGITAASIIDANTLELTLTGPPTVTSARGISLSHLRGRPGAANSTASRTNPVGANRYPILNTWSGFMLRSTATAVYELRSDPANDNLSYGHAQPVVKAVGGRRP